MAIFRVDHTAGGDGSGDSWINAYTSLRACFDHANTIAGSDVYVDDGSVSTYSAHTTLASKGTFASPINIYCVDKADDSYSTGAIEDADDAAYDILLTGFANVYGLYFKAGDDFIMGASNIGWRITDSHIQLSGGSGADLFFGVQQDGAFLRLINTNLTFGNVGQGISLADGSVFEWLGGVLNTDLAEMVESHGSKGGIVRVRGVDLSAMNGGAFFNGFGTVGNEAGFYGEITGCKLHATPPVLVTDTLPAIDGVYLAMIGCGSAGVPQTHVHTSQGDITQETTVKRTATYDGTNGYCFNMTTNANSAFDTPLRFKLAEVWCAANPTLTVEATHDAQGSEAGGNFGDDEFWIEIEYPDSTVPAYRKWDRTSRMPTLGSSTIRSAGTSGDWTSGKTDFDKVVETISGGGAGIHTVWAVLAPASKTVYVCPKLDVS